jgi:hypothetical protein
MMSGSAVEALPEEPAVRGVIVNEGICQSPAETNERNETE